MIFGDDARGKIVGIGSLIFLGLSRLKGVLLFEGLTVNLISVSQLYDDGLFFSLLKKSAWYFIKINTKSWKEVSPQTIAMYEPMQVFV